MSKIGDFFRNVGRIFASPFNKVLGTGLTQAQHEQNEFNASEAALNREFQSNEAALQREWSAAEAERARDWNEEMYEKYNSLSGKIAQAEQTGVNPLFAVTGDSVTPAPTSSPVPSGSAAAGSAAAGSLSSTDSFVNLIGQLMGAQKIQSEIAVNESIAEKNRAEAERTGWLSKLSEREYNIITENNFDVQEIESRIGLNHDQANMAFQLAGKYFEEAGKIAAEKDFFVKTADDREKIIEYDRLIKEFESSMSSALDSLSSQEKLSLKEWVSIIFKSILALK